MPWLAPLAFGILLLAGPPTALAGSRTLLLADQDLTVSEMHPDSAQRETTRHTLDAGIGRGGRPLREGRSSAYLRFDLSAIPPSGWLEETSIDAAELRLFALAHALTPADERFVGKRYLVSAGSCADTDWSESEMSWNTRVCQGGQQPQDTRIIDGDLLPAPVLLEVSQAVAQAASDGQRAITLIVDAQRLLNCPRDPLQGRGCPDAEQIGFLRFASRERADFGLSVVPQVVVRYTVQPTALMQFVSTTLAVLSAIGMLLGLYGAVKGLRRRPPDDDLTDS